MKWGLALAVIGALGVVGWLAVAPRPATSVASSQELELPLDDPLPPAAGRFVHSSASASAPIPAPGGSEAGRLREQLLIALAKTLSDGGLPEPDEGSARYVKALFEDSVMSTVEGCYGALLVKQPAAAGQLVLAFSLVSEPRRGAVALSVRVEPDSGLASPGFEECLASGIEVRVFSPAPGPFRVLSVEQALVLGP